MASSIKKKIFFFLFGKTKTVKTASFDVKGPKQMVTGDHVHPLVSCVIPALNEEKSIEKCIGAILADHYPRKEIVVVNDASTDKTLSIVKKIKQTTKVPIHIITNKKRKGVGLSRDIGVKKSSGDYLVFLDAHSVQQSNTFITQYLAHFKDRSIGAVKGGEKWQPYYFTDWVLYYAGGLRPTRESFDLLSSPNSMYARQCYESIGGMDSNWSSDLITTCRILEKGWKIGYAYEIKIFTDHEQTPLRWIDFLRKNFFYGLGLSHVVKNHTLCLLRRKIDFRIVGGGFINLLSIILFVVMPWLWSIPLITIFVTRAHNMVYGLLIKAPIFYVLSIPVIITISEIAYMIGFFYGLITRPFSKSSLF